MELLATSAEYATASDCRMGAPAVRERRYTGGAAAFGSGEHSSADQARSGRKRSLARAATRHSGPAGMQANFSARGIASPAIGGVDQLGNGWRARAANRADPGRPALGRSDNTRCLAWHSRTRRDGAVVRSADYPAGVPAVLGGAFSSRRDFVGAARPSASAAHGGGARRPSRAGEGGD